MRTASTPIQSALQLIVATALLGGSAVSSVQAQEPSVADRAGAAASSAATKTGHAIHRGASKTADAASDAGHAMHRGASKAGDAISDGADSASAAVKRNVHKAHKKMQAASEAQ